MTFQLKQKLQTLEAVVYIHSSKLSNVENLNDFFTVSGAVSLYGN